MRILTALAFITFACAAAGCGNTTPTSPTTTPTIAGNWTGTLESSNFDARAVDVTFTQGGSGVNGNWSNTSSDWNGTISGTVSGNTFTGTFAISMPSFTGIGPRCTGTASVNGPVPQDATTLRWTSTGFSGSCNGMPSNLTWNLQRK